MRKRLNGLTALKGLACLGIFSTHAWKDDAFSGVGAMCVSLFLIISGFTMVYSYFEKERIQEPSVTHNVEFSFQKTKRLYPLYALTTCLMIVFLLFGQEKISGFHILTLTGLNALFLQEWLPLNYASINNVAWFLCVSVFSYFLFPWVLYLMEHNFNVNKARFLIGLMFILQVLVGLIGKYIQTPVYISNGWLEKDFTHWFIYEFPLSRITDFIIGCNLGYLFIHQKESCPEHKIWVSTIGEILTWGGRLSEN